MRILEGSSVGGTLSISCPDDFFLELPVSRDPFVSQLDRILNEQVARGEDIVLPLSSILLFFFFFSFSCLSVSTHAPRQRL